MGAAAWRDTRGGHHSDRSKNLGSRTGFEFPSPAEYTRRAGSTPASAHLLLVTLVFLLTLVTSSCVTTWKNTTLTFTILDVGTTTYALKSNPNGYNELNPITGQNLVLTYVINACFLYALDTTLKEDHEWVIPALLKIASATWNVYTLTGGGHAEQGNSMQTRSPELSTRQLHPGLLRGHRAYSLKQE